MKILHKFTTYPSQSKIPQIKIWIIRIKCVTYKSKFNINYLSEHMRAIMSGILMIVLSVASATAGIRHYFDYLGSTRAIVNADGEVEQTVDYLSTGIPIKGGKGEIIDDRLHTGKQYLSLNGSLLYDNVARYYSPVHGRFITPDALSSTYPHISHYAHCANNPLSIIDPTGNDIVVLNYGNDIKHQHLAMLIQNEDHKWQYYSINGNNVYLSGEFKGGRPFNDVGVGSRDSPIDFFDSEYNETQGEAGKQNRNINNYGFSEGYHIKTTPEQDEIMRNSFIQISKTEYKLLGNNCATAVQKVMFDANIPVAESKYETISIPANTYLGESGYKIVKPNFDVYPSSAFESIINANPNGEYIKHNNY